MAPILIFLAGPVGRWLVITALVAAVVGGAYFKIKSIGWNERDEQAIAEMKARDDADAAATARYIARIEAYKNDLDARLDKANAKIKELEAKRRELFAQLDAKVNEYVPKEADKRISECGGIPDGFVRHFNAAAEGSGPLPPAPESRVLGADSGVALSEIARTAAFNANQFHRCIEALKGWEAWYPEVKQAYEANLGD